MKKSKVDLLIVVIIVIQGLINIIFFPNLESPDAITHYRAIVDPYEVSNIEKSLYYDFFKVVHQNFGLGRMDLVQNDFFTLLTWEPVLDYSGQNNSAILFMLIIQLIITCSFIFFFYIFLLLINTAYKALFFKVYLLYLLYPAISFGYNSLSPDYVTYMMMPFLIVLLFKRRYVLFLTVTIFIYKFIDQGIIFTIYFLFVFLIMKWINKKQISFRKSTIFVLLGIISSMLFIRLAARLGGNVVIDTINYNQEYYGFLPTKFLNFLLSLVSFPGSGNYFTFPAFYPVVLITIFVMILGVYKYQEATDISLFLKLACMASIFVIVTSIIILPPFSHIRFYLFFVFLIILGIVYTYKKGVILRNDYYYLSIASLFFFHNVLLSLTIGFKVFNF